MKKNKILFQSILLLFLVLFLMNGTILAQTPPGNPGNTVTLSSFLEEIVTNFVAFKTAFINTTEGTLGGYFAVLAYITAWIVAVAYFIQQCYRGAWDFSEIGQFTGRLIICLMLLIFCGDVDGDGRRSDIIRYGGFLGYWAAFGESPQEPTGSYINQLVNTERNKFNQNYDAFVENKLMVKINEVDMPVRYPGMSGVQTVAAVMVGMPNNSQKAEFASQAFWVGLLFQAMNTCRSGIEIIDFMLIATYSYGILILSLIAPFMCCVFVNRDLAKRLTYPFFWAAFTITVVFPMLSQTARYFAYLCGNFAVGTSGSPNYTYDPTTFTIVANGDPTPMILVAVFCMGMSILFLIMSLVLSYAFVQGKLIESVGGLIANAFGGLSSVGLGAVVGAYANKISTAGETSAIEGAEASTLNRAGFNLEQQKLAADNARNVNSLSAEGNYTASMLGYEGTRASAQISSVGQLMSGLASNEATRVSSVNGAVSNFRHSLANMGTEEKQAFANNLADKLSKNNDAGSKKMADELRLDPDRLDLLAENYENALNGIPVIGSVAKTLGANKDSMNAWTRTDGVKNFGQWMFGNPETGDAPKQFLSNGVLGMKQLNMAGDDSQKAAIYGSGQTPYFERADGTMVNALTGENAPQMSTMTSGEIFATNAPGVNNLQGFMASLTPRERKTMQENQKSLQNLMKSDPQFLPAVQSFAQKHQMNSNDMLNLMAIESGFQKTAANSYGYIGLGQVGRAERQSIGWSGNDATDLNRLHNMTPTQQLDNLVFPFMEKKLGAKLEGANLSTLYASWGSGHATGNPNAVHMWKDGGKAGRGAAYAANPAWDANRDGKVQEWEFGVAPVKKLGAGIAFDANGSRNQLRVPRPITSYPTSERSVGTVAQSYNQSSAQIGSVVQPMNGQNPAEFYNVQTGMNQIRSATTAPNQKFVAKKVAVESEYQNSLANNDANFAARNQINQQAFGEKRVNEQNYTSEQIQTANTVSGIQQSGLYSNFGAQRQASQTLYSYQSQSAGVTRGTALQSGEMNYQTSLRNADLQYRGEAGSAAITKAASLDALYKKNEAAFINQVGGGLAHQISELFERASRGMN